jgi:hypothetical protein
MKLDANVSSSSKKKGKGFWLELVDPVPSDEMLR